MSTIFWAVFRAFASIISFWGSPLDWGWRASWPPHLWALRSLWELQIPPHLGRRWLMEQAVSGLCGAPHLSSLTQGLGMVLKHGLFSTSSWMHLLQLSSPGLGILSWDVANRHWIFSSVYPAIFSNAELGMDLFAVWQANNVAILQSILNAPWTVTLILLWDHRVCIYLSLETNNSTTRYCTWSISALAF